jgi:hypothetical protein
MPMANELLEAALNYRDMGISIFPVNPKDKRPAIPSWLKYQTELASPEEINEWYGKMRHQGIAIVTGKLSNIFVVDLDKYKPDFDEEFALRFFPDSLETPMVKTIRGGLHLYFQNPGDVSIRAGILPGIDYRGNGGYVVAPPTKNIAGHSYQWIIDLATPLLPLPEAFYNILLKDNIILNNNTIYRGMSHSALQTVTSVTNCDIWSNGKRDENLFHVALCLARSGADENYIQQTLVAIMKSWSECDEKWANAKARSAIERKSRKERNISQEVEAWLSMTSGDISVTNCDIELKIVTKEDKATRRQAFHRLCKAGIIEKRGAKDGVYRYIDKSEDETIDVFSADLIPYDISLPLEIHEYVTIHKSNVIVIAGESNSGKTSFCLNVARLNRKKHNVTYLSSEMQDGTELRIRLNEFNEPIENWRPVKFAFRQDNFPDRINPDGLNIIDYLDEGVEGEAYKMGARIKDIAQKLKSGVAVIAIQKDPNKPYGYGGSGTLNRARLYLTTTKKGIMTIEKGKVWRNKTWNPNGSYCEYKLVGGCHYIQDIKGWIR